MKKRVKHIAILYLVIILIFAGVELLLQYTGVKSNRWYRLTSIFPEGALTIVNEKENFDRRTEVPLCIPDPVLFWKMAPDRTGTYMETARVVTNSRGFRSPEFADRKPRGTYRILCLGDSATFGLCVGQDETYPALLQQLLAEAYPSRKFEVINTGVPGYTSLQGRGAAEEYIGEFEPDLVTFALGINDLAGSGRLTDAEWYRWNGGVARRLSFLFQKSELYTLLERFLVFLKRKALGLLAEGKGETQGVPRRVPLEDFEENVRDVVSLCRRRGADIVLVREAVKKEPWLEEKIGLMEKQLQILRNVAAEDDAIVVDLWAAMGEAKQHPEGPAGGRRESPAQGGEETQQEILERLNLADYDPLFVDHFHPNAAGNRIIARKLFEAVRESPSFARFLGEGPGGAGEGEERRLPHRP